MAKKFRYDEETALVKTGSGFVHGYEYDGVTIFKGIPYAKAKRFRDPEPVSWDGILETTCYGYACPVINPPALDKSLDFARRGDVKNEDCQNLNIWTPGLDNGKRPVLVWLHGGAMSFGSSSEDGLCDGENMARFGDVVVVSVNHRLNILGFMDLSDYGEEFKNSGNEGIADLVAALRFVRDNIALFGGDPENVTLFGQSGGGMKVTALLQSPAADGLYQKGILISGVQGGAMCDCVGSGKTVVEELMKELGISTVQELCEIPFELLAKAFAKVRPKYKFHGYNAGEMPFRNEYYAGDPGDCPFRKKTAHIPLLVGSTFGEFDAPKSYGLHGERMSEEEMLSRIEAAYGQEASAELVPLFREAYPDRPVIDILSMDYMFRCYILDYMKKRTALNDCTWTYLFNLNMPMYGGVSPLHGNDLGFVFHTTDRAPALQEPGVTEEVEKQVFETVIAFARTGNPNHEGLPEWPASTPSEMNTMIFGKETALRVNHDTELNAAMAGRFLEKQLAGLYASVAGA